MGCCALSSIWELARMPDDIRNIEIDLDQGQPVEPVAVEGAWGLYEELVQAKEAAAQTAGGEGNAPSALLGLEVARPEGSAELTSLSGRLRNFDDQGNQLAGDNWISFSSFSSGAAIQTEVLRDGEIYTEMQGGGDFSNLNRSVNQLLSQLEVGETGSVNLTPEYLRVENLNQDFYPVDENKDLGNGIPILSVTKIDEQLQNPGNENVRLATAWQSTGTNELVLDSTPLNGADFAQKLNALISTEANLGPFSWSSIQLSPTQESRDNGIGTWVYLDLKDIDDEESAGRWVQNQQIGASNKPGEGSDLYTYEYSSTNSWNFKEIYSSLKEGESATWTLERIHINTGDQWTDIYSNSERIDAPLSLTLVETNPNPTETSLQLEGLSFEIDAEISLDQIFDEQGQLDKSFIKSLINSEQQSVDFWSNYRANVDGQDYWFHSSGRETEWNGKELEEQFNLPWNTVDFINAAINSGLEELTLTRDYSGISVQSDTVRENYYANIDRSGNVSYKRHDLPQDYEGDPIDPADPTSIWRAPETITLSLGDLQELAEKFSPDAVRPDVLRFGNYELSNTLLSLDNVMVNDLTGTAIEQIAVLGNQAKRSGDYRLDITAESLSKVHNLEALEVTIQFDPLLFESLKASDIQISSLLPIQNGISIDNEAGTVTLSGASLANLGQGSMINAEAPLASINLSFDNKYLETVAFDDVTGQLDLSPITFQMNVGEEEVIFSRDFTDEAGQHDRSIQSLAELGGEVALNSNKVSLIREIVRMEEENGLTLGTQRTIGVKNEFTNLVREGATLEASTEWRNSGNTTVDGLKVQAIHNENAKLVDAQFSGDQTTLESGRFVNGEWVAEAAESTQITAKIEVTGKAGQVVDLSEGILGVSSDTSDEVFRNEQGSKNLITYQGDLNYDGRVSFKDLAYLNAGAARQELVDKVDENGNGNKNKFGTDEQVATAESYASDVDANYDGKISIADLSVLEKDWGKSLHTGEEAFLGSGEKLDWESIDGGGTWDNSSFKRENEIAADQLAEAAAAASLEPEPVVYGSGVSANTPALQEEHGLLGQEST